MSQTPAKCFALMPFDDTITKVYNTLLKPPLETKGFQVRRADSLSNHRSILQDIVEGIAEADLVIADMTGLNANVSYELGMAHALGKRTVIITQDISTLPFDLKVYRAIEYSTEFSEASELTELVKEIADAVQAGTSEFSNPVQDYAPEAFLSRPLAATNYRANSKGLTEGSRFSNDGLVEGENDAPGFLEAAVAIENASSDLQVSSERIATLTKAIGGRFIMHTERIARAQRNLGNRASGALLAIARDTARDLDEYAEDMEQPVQDMQDSLDAATSAANVIAKHGQFSSTDDIASAESLIEDLKILEATQIEVYGQVTEFASTMVEVPHVDRKLTTAASRTSKVVLLAAEAIDVSAAEFSRARGVIESRLDAVRQ